MNYRLARARPYCLLACMQSTKKRLNIRRPTAPRAKPAAAAAAAWLRAAAAAAVAAAAVKPFLILRAPLINYPRVD